ncbi:MAG: DUF4276 family protein [Synechococcus sp. SB0666_bin_14]|nr:DUF4276 family protein [Synechococcus sp. SB0666_bin_14]MYG46137.1 DUF4276 family protein [Synechococcus sp. SB0675_bin_6]MYJ59282.1 DUF4276 family protein [Synechococcus sp. SB0672_bin_6]MYK91256.1 DUF4276 family protein [Synechococcus sp. SB0669_bin_8]
MGAPHIEFLVEEPSMEAFLKPLLRRCLPAGCTFRIHAHQGKLALLRKLENRLRGYASFLPENHRIVVVVDLDKDQCDQLKSKLEEACAHASLKPKRAAGGSQWQVVTRIAIEELEAWYFGDWGAVCKAFPKVSPTVSRRSRYGNTDVIQGGTWEAFERVLKKFGYCKQGLPKVQTATAMGQHMEPEDNSSPSFQVFWQAITEAVA